jgi:N-acetylglucosamine kinase
MLTTLKPSFFLGIDAGGTKTEASISNESGFVIGRGHSAGANPHNVPLNIAFTHVQEAIEAAIDSVHHQHPDVSIETFEASCLGMAGIDTPRDFQMVRNFLETLPTPKQTLNSKRLLITNDGLIGLKSGTEENFGICLIASTGANCYGVSTDGETTKAGDWGYILGDQASGYAMGQAILRQVMKEYDGRLPKSELTDKVLAFLNFKSASEIVPWVYKSRVPIMDVASLSHLCNESSLITNAGLGNIIDHSVTELLSAYESVYHKLRFTNDILLPVVLIGGLFTLDVYTQKVVAALSNRTTNVQIIFPKHNPSEGAIRLALMANYSKTLPKNIIILTR